MTLFQPGRPKTGGRRKGVRDKISTSFLEALYEDWEVNGKETIKFARHERPIEYLKIVGEHVQRLLKVLFVESVNELLSERFDFMDTHWYSSVTK